MKRALAARSPSDDERHSRGGFLSLLSQGVILSVLSRVSRSRDYLMLAHPRHVSQVVAVSRIELVAGVRSRREHRRAAATEEAGGGGREGRNVTEYACEAKF